PPGAERPLWGEGPRRPPPAVGGVRAGRRLRARGAARGPGLLLRRWSRRGCGGQRARQAREPVESGAPGRECGVLPGEGARDLGPLPRLRRVRRPAAARPRRAERAAYALLS